MKTLFPIVIAFLFTNNVMGEPMGQYEKQVVVNEACETAGRMAVGIYKDKVSKRPLELQYAKMVADDPDDIFSLIIIDARQNAKSVKGAYMTGWAKCMDHVNK